MSHPNYLKSPCPAPAKISAISDLCSVFIQQHFLKKKLFMIIILRLDYDKTSIMSFYGHLTKYYVHNYYLNNYV